MNLDGSGLIDMDQLIKKLSQVRNGMVITREDVTQAIKSLAPLGAGYQVLQVGDRQLVQCTPIEMNRDDALVVQEAS